MMMNDLTMKQAYDFFMLDRETFCSQDTITNYKNTLRYFFQYLEEIFQRPADQIRLSELNTNMLRNYVVFLRSKPLNAGHPFKLSSKNTVLSKRSVRNYSLDIKTFFHFLTDEGFCDDITRGFKLIKSERKTINPLTASEIQIVDDVFNLKTVAGCRNLCVIHLMLDAGLRSNEVCQLRVDHVLFDNRQIFVKYGKGSKERIVPMGLTLKRYLWQWFNLYRGDCENDFFITSTGGEPFSDSAMKSMFARLKKKVTVSRLYPHLLRHTFATCFILGGGSVEMLRILLGHEDIETTQKYMHIATIYDFNNDVYKLDPIFFKGYHRK